MSVKIPFLIDKHNHFFTYSSLFNSSLNLFNCKKKQEAINLINKCIPDNNIVIATGWLDNYFALNADDIRSDKVILIIHNSLHKFLFNESAGKIFEKSFPDFVKNHNNQQWIEMHLMQILSFIANLNVINETIINNSIENFLNEGVCFASEMYVDKMEIISLFEKMQLDYFTEIWTNSNFYQGLSDEKKAKCKGIKIFADGALGARSAATEGFKGNSNPILIYSDKEIHNKISELLSLKADLAIHCIGEISIEQIVNSLNKLKSEIRSKIRLEHCQFINKKQAFKAKDLGLILSMQPNFNMDSEIYRDRLKEEYVINNNPFRMLIDEAGFVPGKDLIFGSDGMPNGAKEALQQSLFPPIEAQKISLEEFVNAYCTDNYDRNIEIEISNTNKTVIIKKINK